MGNIRSVALPKFAKDLIITQIHTYHSAYRADTPEQIRRALDDDSSREFLQSDSGKWYTIEDGELREVAA